MTGTGDARTLSRRWFEEMWNGRRDELIGELMPARSLGHVEGGEVEGPEGFRKMRAMFLSAVPDLRIEIEDILAEGDQAVVRWRVVGTHTGDGFGFPATNRRIDQRGMSWLVWRDGQLVEGWDTWNLGGMMGSLTAAEPAPPPRLF